jgi:mannose-6-phosphate isomerase-like protein (cupin superfamily)
LAAVVIVAAVVLITLFRGRTAADSHPPTTVLAEGTLDRKVLAGPLVRPVTAGEGNGFGRFTLSELLAEHTGLGRPYLEFLRGESMSLGVYVLPADGVDRQCPHAEDEAYFVVRGRSAFRMGGVVHAVEPGTILFVPAGVEHRFEAIREPLTLLVFFSPAETVSRTAPRELAGAEC